MNLQGDTTETPATILFLPFSHMHGSKNKPSCPHKSFPSEKCLQGCVAQSFSHSSPPFPGFQLRGRDSGPQPGPKDRRPRLPPENLSVSRVTHGSGLNLTHPKDSSWEKTTMSVWSWWPQNPKHKDESYTLRAAGWGTPRPRCPNRESKSQCACLSVTCTQSHTRYSIMFSCSRHPGSSVACSQRALRWARSPTITQSWRFSYSLCTPL